MNALHILNVGRADCQILLLDTAEGQKTVVIDAGALCCQGREPLWEFLKERRIDVIDLAILTHLHQDHFGGFHQLIGRVSVKRMIAPCGDLVFQESVYPVFGDREFYREYHRIFQYFQQTHTELYTSAECAGEVFSFGESSLRCLYPKEASALPSVVSAQELCGRKMDDAEMLRVLEEHKEACNQDSSIWLLSHSGKQIALFAADSTDETMRAALEGLGPVRPEVQKLSHHGINARYFSKDAQKMISPRQLVISVDKDHYNDDMKETVDELAEAGHSEIHYTFQGDFVQYF